MTITFDEYLDVKSINESSDYKGYLKVTQLLEKSLHRELNEDLVDLLPPIQRAQYDFIKAIALQSNLDAKATIKLFKDSRVYAFFKKIQWNLQNLFDLVKKGFDAYLKVQYVIADYVAKTGITKWTDKELKKLQEFLNEHPILKKIGGVAVAGLLLFIWLEGTHFVHPEDFDFTEIMEALDGNYDLHHLLGGGHGIRLLAVFVTALTGIGFHYHTPKALNFIVALLYSLQKTLKII